jgi:hypothetical protein
MPRNELPQICGDASLPVYPPVQVVAEYIRVWGRLEERTVPERVLELLFSASFFRGDVCLYFPWK